MSTIRLGGRVLTALAVLALLGGCDDDETTTTTTGPTGATGATGASGGTQATPKPEHAVPVPASPRVAVSASVKAVLGRDVTRLACGELVTERYLRDSYGGAQGCRSAQEAEGTFDVRVRDVEVAESTATAVAIPEGGPNEGIEHDVELVLEDDVWKVDRLRADVPAGP